LYAFVLEEIIQALQKH